MVDFAKLTQDHRLVRCGLRKLPKPFGLEYRVSGEVYCNVCGQQIRHHPRDTRVLGYDGNPVWIIICNGDRVKI